MTSYISKSVHIQYNQHQRCSRWQAKWRTLISLFQCNVLLGNLWSWQLCGCSFDMLNKYKPLMVMAFLDGTAPTQDDVPHHTAKTAQEWPKKWNINLTVLTRPPASADPNLIKHSWDMQDQVQSMDPASQLTGLGRFTANALNCRQNGPPLKGPVSVSWGVRAESNSQWGLYVWNLFQNVQQMFVRIEI